MDKPLKHGKKKRQKQKAIYLQLYLYEMSRIGKSTETEDRLITARVCKEEIMESDAYRYRISFGG